MLNDAIEVGTPGAARLAAVEPTGCAGRLCSSLNRLVSAAVDADRAAAARGHVRHREAAGASTSSRRRPSATTGTTGSRSCPNGLSDRDQVGLHVPPVADPVPGLGDRPRPRSTATRPRSRTGRIGDGARRHVQAVRDPDPQRAPLRADRPAGRRLPGRPVRLRTRPGPGPGPVAEQPGLRHPRPAREPRADDAVLQRRQPARAARHADRLAPAADLEAGGPMRRARGRRLPSWAIGLVIVVVARGRRRSSRSPSSCLGDTVRGPGRVRAPPRACAPSSPVRIAGVERRQGDLGRAADRGRQAEITAQRRAAASRRRRRCAGPAGRGRDDGARRRRRCPIHSDATFKLRPRLFLEGNYFVDMRPGQPERRRGRGRCTRSRSTRPPTRCSSTRC